MNQVQLSRGRLFLHQTLLTSSPRSSCSSNHHSIQQFPVQPWTAFRQSRSCFGSAAQDSGGIGGGSEGGTELVDLDPHRILNLSISELAQELENGTLTSTDVTKICLERIENTGALKAFVSVDRDHALKAAMESDERRARGEALGPLDGIPLGVKDNFVMKADPDSDPNTDRTPLTGRQTAWETGDHYSGPNTSSHPTTAASRMLRNFYSPYESTVTRRLHAAGAVILGKTNMDEFGMGSSGMYSDFGWTINPWSFRQQQSTSDDVDDGGSSPSSKHHPRRRSQALLSAGGSSSGSAASTAAGMVFGAIGSDTGGSVRLPASYCGIVGFKPSYGRVSRFGMIAYSSSFDTPGVFGKTVRDARLLAAAISGPCEFDSMSTEFRDSLAAPEEADEVSLSLQGRSRGGSEGREMEMEMEDRITELLQGVRIGIPRDYDVEELNPDTREAWLRAAGRLQEYGAEVVFVELPATRLALPAYYITVTAEASSNLARYDGVRFGHSEWTPLEVEDSNGGRGDGGGGRGKESLSLTELFAQNRSHGFGNEVKRRILLGNWVLSSSTYQSYVERAHRIRRMVIQDFQNVFFSAELSPQDHGRREQTESFVDVLLTPTASGVAPTIEAVKQASHENPVTEYLNDVMTVPANLAGLPSISVPFCLSRAEQLPIGLQLIGQKGQENQLLRVAEALEGVSDFQPLDFQ